MKRLGFFVVMAVIVAACQTESGTGVDNNAPTAHAGGPYTAAPDGSVQFNGSASTDPDSGDALTYAWTFGDNSTGTGVNPAHTYAAAGSFIVSLTVTDSHGATSTPDSTTATVGSAGATVTFVGAGNIGNCRNNNDEATAQLIDAMPANAYVFTTGDNAYDDGSLTAYNNCYAPTWGRFKDRTFPVAGNHEYTLGNANGFFDYFGTRTTRDKGYFSADIGAWHVIVLNDNFDFVDMGATSAQRAWLVADLAANTKACTVALWHVPLFFSSDTAGYTVNSKRQSTWQVLYDAGVDIVLNGQSHHYERLAPMKADGTLDPTNGIRSWNVGTGGESVAPVSVAIHPNSEVRGADFGVLKLTLKPNGYDWQFVGVPGSTFTDSGSGTCH